MLNLLLDIEVKNLTGDREMIINVNIPCEKIDNLSM